MSDLTAEDGLLARVRRAQPVFWRNPAVSARPLPDPLAAAVDEASARMRRSRRLLRALFPACRDSSDPIRSPLLDASALAEALGGASESHGRWWIKADHQLPVAGSVKARGGFHEVIAFAERLALREGFIAEGTDLLVLAEPKVRALFARYTVVVGSTGNLGMSIGLVASALGFKAVVHMSSDAKAWKKQRLRDHGVTVHEHTGDYALAVENGRAAAERDPFAHFVDDERSLDLFVGYAAAAGEASLQFAERGLDVDDDHPLFVYIPCGVGGAPGGITYGLKRLYGPHVHCIFAEPVQSPCMLVQLIAGDSPTSVYDLGLSNKTEADGLAVAQASMLVAPLMRERVDGVFTLTDEHLDALLRAGESALGLQLEPSAAAPFAGPAFLETAAGRAYLEAAGLAAKLPSANHLLWTTGGSLIPDGERQRLVERAARARPFDLDRA